MTRRMKGSWLLAVLAVSAAMLAVGTEAWAKGGITVTGGQKPGGGDPPYDYILQVYLDPGFGVASTNFFTVESLLGVTPPNFPVQGQPAAYPGSATSEPNNAPSVIWVPSISFPTQTTFPYASDVTWSFFGNTSISNGTAQKLYLGQFVVDTTVSFTNPPYIPGTNVDYTFTVLDANGNQVSGGGMFPMILLGVPEPSSVFLLVMGAGVLPLLVLHERQRQRENLGQMD